jgi:hypothetical protein
MNNASGEQRVKACQKEIVHPLYHLLLAQRVKTCQKEIVHRLYHLLLAFYC